MLTSWNENDPNSHFVGGFEFGEGRLHVPVDGLYYVYAQLYFNSTPNDSYNRVAVYAGNKLILMIHKDLRPGVEETGFTGGVFRLNAGDAIYVKVVGLNPTKMWLGPNASYFGAYKIWTRAVLRYNSFSACSSITS